jgi:hypothetical protein
LSTRCRNVFHRIRRRSWRPGPRSPDQGDQGSRLEENIETRNLFGKNLASISDAEFDSVCEKLDAAGVKFNCYGSAIANWQKPITEGPESSYEEFRKAIPRLRKLGTKLVRMMSFAVPAELKPRAGTSRTKW